MNRGAARTAVDRGRSGRVCRRAVASAVPRPTGRRSAWDAFLLAGLLPGARRNVPKRDHR